MTMLLTMQRHSLMRIGNSIISPFTKLHNLSTLDEMEAHCRQIMRRDGLHWTFTWSPPVIDIVLRKMLNALRIIGIKE